MFRMFVAIAVLSHWSCAVVSSLETRAESALHECTNLHHLQFNAIPNASGRWLNSGCELQCSVGSNVLATHVVNQAFPCPEALAGMCHNGQCVARPDYEANRECTNQLQRDWLNLNNQGTTFLNDQCTVRCVKDRVVMFEGAINEGYHCPSNDTSRVCKSGQCVHVDTAVTTALPTTVLPSKGTVIFATHKLSEVIVGLRAFHLTKNHSNVFLEVCLQAATTLEKSVPPRDCKQLCFTDAGEANNTSLIWSPNRSCELKDNWSRFEQGDDNLKFSVVTHTVNGNEPTTLAEQNYALEQLVKHEWDTLMVANPDPNHVLTFTRNATLYHDRVPVGWLLSDFEVHMKPRH